MFGGDDSTNKRVRGDEWSDDTEHVNVSSTDDIVRLARVDHDHLAEKLKGRSVWRESPGFTFSDPRCRFSLHIPPF